MSVYLLDIYREEKRKAFSLAIKKKVLSKDPQAYNYHDNFIYMGTNDDGSVAFKHRSKRTYFSMKVRRPQVMEAAHGI